MNLDQVLLHEIESGLPLVEAPFAAVGARIGMPESEVMERISRLTEEGTIRRFGVVVKHRNLGLNANAMVTWQVEPAQASEAGRKLRSLPFVTLAYRRRTSERWPFNLYAMIHGSDRAVVEQQANEATAFAGLDSAPRKILFSRRCFKQKGASYLGVAMEELDRRILNRLQEGIGAEEHPFQAPADELGISVEVLLARLRSLLARGKLSRFGPMFNVEKFGGVFTLVALAVPSERFEDVTKLVNGYPEVAHNYARDHRLNMWFVVATESQQETDRVLQDIHDRTGLTPLALPKLEEYYLNLRVQA